MPDLPSRRLRLLERPQGDTPGLFAIFDGTRFEVYVYLPDAAGAVFIRKAGGTNLYSVRGGLCTCPGFAARGRCRHAAAVAMLGSHKPSRSRQ